MLDCGNARELIAQVWTKLGCEVELPSEWTEYFDVNGEVENDDDERRKHPRYQLRDKAILARNNHYYCIFTKDVSRSGIGFLFSEQLFPHEDLRLWLPTGRMCHVAISRCQRVGDKCFECACVIQKGPENAANEGG